MEKVLLFSCSVISDSFVTPWNIFVCYSVTKLCPTLCNPMDCSVPGFPVLHHLLEFAQAHVHLVKVMVFPVVMYGCESWKIKKAEGQRIDAFELQCWRRLLRVAWTAKISNQLILENISPEYSL